ncbi:MAG TPA: CpsB/CapC family capsule biosynthesis tyrosine phosphatase [Cyclobacteriaceae bacterium]|nr:CpsB/CapC family capsule biosynthesis tyrosine phosphatase [Cyclobacteriaceae bacterium]
MINWLRKKTDTGIKLTTDIHSHLLAGLDDGVKTLEEAESIVRIFQHLGYTKLITTPHVMQDHYRNTPETIRQGVDQLNDYLSKRAIHVNIEVAAEYYLDEHLVKDIERNAPVLTFGNNYLLFETNFLSEPLNLNEFIFIATTQGYKLVLAHPERYVYLQNNMSRIEDLINRGVLFQLNAASIAGAYSKPVQTLANKLIDLGFAHLIGSDCHNIQHAKVLEQIQNSRYFKKALTLPLLNNSL